MKDYISREAAIDAISEWLMKALHPENTSSYNEGERAAYRTALSEIAELPAADVRPEWIMIESRPMDAEERQYYSEQYGYELTDEEAIIYCSQLPEHGQEVLVCDKWGHIWIDTFNNDPDYGVGFETNGDMDGLVAWMPLPEPPEEVLTGTDMRGGIRRDDAGNVIDWGITGPPGDAGKAEEGE